MADTYEQNLGQKSSLTASDFIRVVGSDNVSYKQPASDVLTKLGKPNFYGLSTNGYVNIPDNADLNTYTTAGSFFCPLWSIAASLSNTPITNSGFTLHVEDVSGNNNIVQTITRLYSDNTSKEVWTRGYNISSDTWGTWQKQPTRAEIDALNSKTYSSYTPTITGGTGFAVDHVGFMYQVTKDFLWIAGRFEITNAGSTNAVIRISYPSGVTAKTTGVVPIGSVLLSKNYSGAGISLRADSTDEMFIQVGAGGYSAPALGTGYILLYALIPR